MKKLYYKPMSETIQSNNGPILSGSQEFVDIGTGGGASASTPSIKTILYDDVDDTTETMD